MPQTRGVAGQSAPQRLGLRRQRRQRPSLGPAAARRARADARCDWALDLVGAADLARRPLAETSGGERQRLLLAQALLGRPRLLLLDEPLISLDPHHQRAVVELARDAAAGARHRRAVQRARTEPAARRARPRAVSRPRPGRARRGGRGRSPGRCCRASTAPRSTWCGSTAASSSCRAATTSSATPTSTTTASTMFTYDFMQNAFAAAGIVAVVAGWSGYFLVLRARPSPAMRCRMSASPARPARC